MSAKKKIISWNINGIRAIFKKDFLSWFEKESPDILCVQETKAQESQIPEALKGIENYYSYFSCAEKKGYSGVGVWTKQKPLFVKCNFDNDVLNHEGRILQLEFNDFILFNVYFPNGRGSDIRLKFKLDFYDIFFAYTKKLKDSGKNVIICGDLNTAHNEIDLARSKENKDKSGFLDCERKWLDILISYGFIDTYRFFNQDKIQYTWWDYKTRARQRNVGWRIDYFFVNKEMIDKIKKTFILDDVLGSDHCPLGIII